MYIRWWLLLKCALGNLVVQIYTSQEAVKVVVEECIFTRVLNRTLIVGREFGRMCIEMTFFMCKKQMLCALAYIFLQQSFCLKG